MKVSAHSLPDPTELLREIIGIPSLSGEEENLAVYINNWAKRAGFEVKRIGRNVVVQAGYGDAGTLLFNSHMDTILPSPDWETDPFKPVLDNEGITGLGANDAKGSVAAMLGAALRIKNAKEIKGKVIIALTVEEERGGDGGLSSIVSDLGKIDAAVIGEPTGLEICRAQKGLVILSVETDGKSRHAAHAHRIEGKNAVVEAARAILAMEGWQPNFVVHPLLGSVTLQVTVINGGSRHNVISDRCSFTLDVRTVPGVSTSDIVEVVRTKTNSRVYVVSDHLKPFETDENAKIVLAATRARPSAKVVGSSTMSDAVWTRHIPTIKIGPGRTERSHTAGEYIEIKEFNDGIAFYERLIREYFS